MKRAIFVLTVFLAAVPVFAAETLNYPAAPRGDVSDTYFGTSVPDPYRWMENLDSSQTMAWVKAENALTRTYLDAIPQRDAIGAKYRKLRTVPTFSPPVRYGSHWFNDRNTGSQTQNVLYIRDSEFGPERVFFDPNKLSKDGSIQVSSWVFSRDGTLMAYATAQGGADWQTWHVKMIPSGKDLPDLIKWSKYSGATWVGDTGFYYSGYDEPKAQNKTLAAVGVQKVWFHRLGTPQSADRLIYASTAHPNEFVSVSSTEDEQYYFFSRSKGDGNSLSWRKRTEPDSAFKPLLPLDPNISYSPIDHDATRLYIQTNSGAPRFKIVAVDLTDPAHAMRDVVAQTADKLSECTLLGDRFFLGYLHDAHSLIAIDDLHGRRVGTVELPGIGSAGVPSAVRRSDPVAYYGYSSFAYPGVTFRYVVATGKSTVFHRSAVAFDPAPYVTEQRFATSKDGTRVPVFVTHRKDMPLDGSTPTILYGYGGFNIPWTPYFSSSNALWFQMGGAYAVATLRGGGEYGDAWHDAGRLANKQHVFDDFIAAAQMLIDSKITSTPKLAINGGSNGGLLVGATLTQRPDLFGAAVSEQGLYDMLRYQKFTIGKAWIPEYGAADASADQFKTLFAYSPLNNVKDGTHYPPTLIETADHDDRVYPSHSFKFVAALQRAQGGDAPILLRVETNEGHFAGLTVDKEVAQVADFYAFLTKSLNFTPSL